MNFQAFLIEVAAFGVIALVGYNAYVYYRTPGTVADRLAAAWRGSLTKFVNAYAFIAAVATEGVDQIAAITQAPEWVELQKVIAQVIPAPAHPYVAMSGLVLGYIARNRTARK